MQMRQSLAALSLLSVLALAACGTHRGVYHTVQGGENLYRIALAYGIPQDEVVSWNGIDDPSEISAGKQLFIPGASKVRRLSAGAEPPRPEPRSLAMPRRQAPLPRQASLDAAPPPPSGKKVRFAWPVQGALMSGFGFREGLHHDGIDISAPEGTSIAAGADGRVLYADDGLSGYGNMIIVRHQGEYSTVYAHCRKLLVEKGDFVKAGQAIATVGQTGRASGPHLHFEVRVGKKAVDPRGFLP